MYNNNSGIRYLKPIFTTDDLESKVNEPYSDSFRRAVIASRARDYAEAFLKIKRPKEPINRPVDDFQT